jgi:hypothetical protein
LVKILSCELHVQQPILEEHKKDLTKLETLTSLDLSALLSASANTENAA